MYSFSINHYGTMYATGKPFKAEDAMGWQTMEEVNKSWEKDGKLIGKRGENGHPHMGKFESIKPLGHFYGAAPCESLC